MAIRQCMIDECVESVALSLRGVKMPVDPEYLHRIFDAGGCTKLIGEMMRIAYLPLQLRVGYVNSGGPKQAPAWIIRPSKFPLYGTSAFRATKATLFIRKSFLEDAPLETIVASIAHELAHIVLDSIKHPLRREEEAVDITAMIMGYVHFFEKGCQHIRAPREEKIFGRITRYFRNFVEEEKILVTTYGYLSPEEVAYAANVIKAKQPR